MQAHRELLSRMLKDLSGTEGSSCAAPQAKPEVPLSQLFDVRGDRVLVYTPYNQESPYWSALLVEAGFRPEICMGVEDLCREVDSGAGTAIVTLDSLSPAEVDRLAAVLSRQPTWSDFALVAVGEHKPTESPWHSLRKLDVLGNALLLERPVGKAALASAIRSALRQRRWQYALRDCLAGAAAAAEGPDRGVARFREVQELSLDAFTFLSAVRDSSGTIIDFTWEYVNPAAARLLHTTPEALLGQRMLDVLPPSQHASEVFRRCVEVMETGVSHDVEVHYEAEDGGGWFRNAAVKLGNGLIIYFSDITERKQIEQALEESEARFRGTFENATVGLAQVDLVGRWIRVNQTLCEILGYSREELLGKTFREVAHPEELPDDLRQFERLVHGEIASYELDQRWFHKEGRELWIHRKMALQRDGAEQPQYCIDVIEDVTERKRAEQELKYLNETLERRVLERTEMLRSLARKLTQTEQRERRRLAKILHDHLQQLLVAARLKSGLLRRRLSDETTRPSFQQIEDLLNQAIDASRSLTVELCPPILYESGLSGALEWLAGEMHENYGLSVHFQTDSQAEPETEDIRIVLFETVRELLFNVVKHAQVNEAHVRMACEGAERLILTVADDGIGFPMTKLHAGGGSGCGLTSIRERLQWMSGRLDIDSAPNRGTRVTISAPRRLTTNLNIPMDLLSEAQDC